MVGEGSWPGLEALRLRKVQEDEVGTGLSTTGALAVKRCKARGL